MCRTRTNMTILNCDEAIPSHSEHFSTNPAMLHSSSPSPNQLWCSIIWEHRRHHAWLPTHLRQAKKIQRKSENSEANLDE